MSAKTKTAPDAQTTTSITATIVEIEAALVMLEKNLRASARAKNEVAVGDAGSKIATLRIRLDLAREDLAAAQVAEQRAAFDAERDATAVLCARAPATLRKTAKTIGARLDDLANQYVDAIADLSAAVGPVAGDARRVLQTLIPSQPNRLVDLMAVTLPDARAEGVAGAVARFFNRVMLTSHASLRAYVSLNAFAPEISSGTTMESQLNGAASRLEQRLTELLRAAPVEDEDRDQRRRHEFGYTPTIEELRVSPMKAD